MLAPLAARKGPAGPSRGLAYLDNDRYHHGDEVLSSVFLTLHF
ncbi:MAG: hypothetical protein QOI66_2567 [Myxococcales bacterium]|jgi:hypothetical protein|nr:hypothetical protein [Myxococcales bacterium]